MNAKSMDDCMDLQGKEFDAAAEFVKHHRRITMTAVVDDDYPEVRYGYDSALRALMRVALANRPTLIKVSDSSSVDSLSHISDVSLARCLRWHPGGLQSWSLSDWGVALAGECGEVCDVIKKLNRVRDGMGGNKRSPAELRADLADEIADVYLYLDLLAQAAGVDLSSAVTKKFNEVSERM